ncbi:Rieske (2Fe-2S) protein [Bremerella sp. P1]|uniref:Rieske (2Fe-2S) protein n=1 Tax=Bremerella sp. P1 TaxID=3026424 RepID=UPI002367496E|nr:nitrite reductase (NAD(P)H) small subunit [Bremerella sp. P1]WDI40649.1 nitrite reductase (NAD(P)H) small subunit [Bremerella sp. P1]
MSQFVPLAAITDLPDQGGRLVVVDDQWIGLFNTDDGIFAIDAMCPHAGANLAKGSVCEGIVSCPVHLWRFRLSDGKYLDADADRFNVKTYNVRSENGQILVELPALPTSIRLI